MKGKKLKTNCLKIACTLIFIAVIGLIFKTLTPNVKAEGNIKKVSPGAETLKKAVEDANPGDTLVLTAGSYSGGGTDKTVYIDKELTIEGEKSGQISKTIIDVPIVVRTPDKVVISNFTTTPIMVEPNFVFIKTEGKVDLDINNIYIYGILRGSSNTLPRHDAKALEITKNSKDVTGSNEVAAESDRSIINVTNCNFVKPGVHYGIYSNASNTTLSIKNSTIAGRTPVMFDDGSNNTMNVLEKTEIDGPDAIYNESETFVIKGQNNLKVNVDNSTIKSTAPNGNVPTKTFSFSEEGTKSTNTTININNSKIIDEDDERKPITNSVIFSFRNDAKAADNNIVNIDKTSSMYISKKGSSYTVISTEKVPLAREYNILENASVVRISDCENNSIIKVYDNNSKIAELTQEKYTKKDNYNFKGWFQEFDGTNYDNEYSKVGDNYPNAIAQKNIDLYPKFAKVLKVTITDGTTSNTYSVEEGTTLSESEDYTKIKEDLDKIQKKEGQIFNGFIVYNSNGHTEIEKEEDLLKLMMTEDCRIEAIHEVKVTINGTEFRIAAGKTLKDIFNLNNDAYNTAKQNGDEREFSRFINTETKETFTETQGITASVDLESKFFCKVTIGDNTYKLEEDSTLNSSEEIKAALAAISEKVSGRKFDRFTDEKGKTINPDNDEITNDITISSIYSITVKLIGKDNKTIETYTIDADSNLSSLKIDDDIKDALEEVANSRDDGKEFDGFIITYDDNETLTFDETSGKNKDDLKQDILNYELKYNATIYVKQNIKITINSEVFEMDSGKSLKTAILDSNDEGKKQKYKNAKFGGKDEKRFYKFIDKDTEKEITEEDIFEKSTVLVPKYLVFVTIEDDRTNVAGTYRLEEGKTIDDLIDKEGQDALAILRTDIDPDPEVEIPEEKIEDLHFEKLVITSPNKEIDLNNEINEDITIKGLYHYDVTIVEDYDNPTYDSEANHVKGLKVYRGENLSTIKNKVDQALNTLKDSVNNNDKRKFYSFLEVNTNKEYTDSNIDELFNKAFNRHIYISAKIYHKVEIGDTEDYVVEGRTLEDSPKLVAALNNLKNTENKQIDKLIVNGKEYSKDEITKDMQVNEYTKISAEYNVNVSINGQNFSVKEGTLFSDLTKQENVAKALEELQTQVENAGYNFKGYIDSKNNNLTKNTKITENTTISAKYNIKVIIKQDEVEKSFELEENQTLSDIKNEENYKTVITKEDRQFSGKFRNQNSEIIDETTKLTKNTILTPIFNVKVTIKEKVYYLEENTELLTPEILEALKVFESTEKQLSGYVYGSDKTPITTESLANENITIEPVYSVKITIKYGEDIIGNFDFNENLSIKDSGKEKEIETALETLKGKVISDGYNFKGYVADKKEFTTETIVSKNITVTASYNIKVTIQGESGPKDFEVEAGSTLREVKANNEEYYQEVQKKDNRKFLHFLVDDSNNTILKNDDNTYMFYKNISLKAVYATTVTINGKKYYLEEDKALSSSDEILEALQKLEKIEKRLAEFKDTNNNLIATIEQLLNKTDKPITENITIIPQYVIDIEIEGNEVFKTTVPENTKLEDIGYVKPERFKRFVDAQTNDTVTEDTILKKHTKLKVIYNVIVTINENKYELESYKKFGDLEGAEKDLEELKNVPATKKNFSHFIYIDNDEEITLDKDTVISKDITVLPKYTVELSFIYENENKQEEIIKLELEEGKAIGDLDNESLLALNEKLREIEQMLEKEGKYSFKFSKFLQADNTEVDIQKTQFNENTVVKATFEYKENPSPVNPTNPEDDNKDTNKDTNKDEPIKVPAPDTGVDNYWNLNNIFLSIIIIILTCGGCLGCLKCAIKK